MRILFLLPDFPFPATTGGRLKVFNVLRRMSAEHQCDILSYGYFDRANIAGLKAILPNVRVLDSSSSVQDFAKQIKTLWCMARGLPPSFAAFQSRTYARRIQENIHDNNYDVIHYDIINMSQYLKFAAELPSIHSPNDATSLVYFKMAGMLPFGLEKIKLLVSAILLRRYEKKNYHHFNMIHVVSEDDAQYLKGLDAKIETRVIPIAVNEDFLAPINLEAEMEDRAERQLKIVCNGNLGNPAIARGLQDFLVVAFPEILKHWPSIRFIVLGQNISHALRAQLDNSPNVEFLEWVDNYRDFIADADVVLVPDCIGPPGAKTRTLQAMGLGRSVVGTRAAFSGISFVNNKHGISYETAFECAEAVCSLLGDPERRCILGMNAHQLVSREYSLAIVGPEYEKMYHDAFSTSRC